MRRGVLAVLVFAGLSGCLTAEAQEWSPAQKEVWKTVVEMNARFYSGDMAGLYEFIDRDFVWWNTANDVPGDYESAKKLDTAYWANARKWLDASCVPLTIQAHETFAVVNTYCRGHRAASPGQDPQWEAVRILYVMKKKDGRWLQTANFIDFKQR
jgi:ketosteroid isomerase-like protein